MPRALEDEPFGVVVAATAVRLQRNHGALEPFSLRAKRFEVKRGTTATIIRPGPCCCRCWHHVVDRRRGEANPGAGVRLSPAARTSWWRRRSKQDGGWEEGEAAAFELESTATWNSGRKFARPKTMRQELPYPWIPPCPPRRPRRPRRPPRRPPATRQPDTTGNTEGSRDGHHPQSRCCSVILATPAEAATAQSALPP